jgi:hypothetical protein
MHELMTRIADNLEFIAADLEQLRLLKEHELGAHIEQSPDPYVKPDDATEAKHHTEPDHTEREQLTRYHSR